MKTKIAVLLLVAVCVWWWGGLAQNNQRNAGSVQAQSPVSSGESRTNVAPNAGGQPGGPVVVTAVEVKQAAPTAVQTEVRPPVTAATSVQSASGQVAEVVEVIPDLAAPENTSAPSETLKLSTLEEMSANTEVVDLAAPGSSSSMMSSPSEDSPFGAGVQNEVLPLVIFDDAPLTDAIRTLARQAGINFQFDPRVTSQVAEDGSPVPIPVVSIRFENVTAQQALEALLSNYGLELKPDPRTTIARITIKDPAAPEPLVTKIVQLKHAAPTNMVTLLQPTLTPRSKVIPDTSTSRLVVIATENEHQILGELIDKLDTLSQQVLIEAKILETSINPRTDKGVDWSGSLKAQNVSFGNGVTEMSRTVTSPGTSGSVTDPGGRSIPTGGGRSVSTIQNTVLSPLENVLGFSANTANGFSPSTAFLNADGLRAVLSFLNTSEDTKVVATPRAVTLDNETADLSVTRAFPIFKVTPGSANVAAGSEVTYTNLGTILKVTPRIAADDMVSLKVTPEVSNIDSKDRQIINGQENEANVYAIRKMETRVVIPSGDTLVMGGMISDSVTKSFTKVPVLGDIPGLGLLFRKDSHERNKSNLLIFITPTIVTPEDFQRHKRTDFLQTTAWDHIPEAESAWNSGVPKDWKNWRKDAESNWNDGSNNKTLFKKN